MGIDDLREDSDALDIRIVLAPVANTNIDGPKLRLHGLVPEQLERATVRESVSVQAQCSLCAEDDASIVVVTFGSHIREGADIEAAVWWGDCGVVYDQKTSLVFWHYAGAAVTEPDEVPVIAVRGMLFELTTLREELELVFECDVPIGVIFDYQG